MPRPPFKRRKLATLQSPFGSHKKKTNLPTAAQTAQVRRELEQKLAHKPVGDRPIDSDDSDRLVTRRSASTTRRNAQHNDVFVSGGVAKGDVPGSHPRGRRSRPSSQSGARLLNKSPKAAANTSAPRDREVDQKSRKSPLRNEYTSPREEPLELVKTSQTKALPSGISQLNATNDVSRLGTLQPRKRKPSILLQQLNAEDSTMSLGLDESLMPEDESTPLAPSKISADIIAPSSTTVPTPPSLKRKYGQQRPATTPSKALFDPQDDLIPQSEKNSVAEPHLPTVPASALRSSDQKSHAKNQADDEDIMALPQSSSSPAPSPVKATRDITTTKKNKVEAITTEQLKTLMPTQRRKTARQRYARGILNIAEDSDGSSNRENGSNDDSTFDLRKTKRKGNVKKGTKEVKGLKLAKDKGSVNTEKKITKAGPVSSSTRPTATPLARTTRNSVAKTIPQQNDIKSISPLVKNTSQESGADKPDNSKRYGGRSQRVKSGGVDKENRLGHLSNSISDGDSEDGEDDDSIELVEVEVARSVQPIKSNLSSKWQEIDDWEMEFEEVDIMTPSDESDMKR